MVRNYDTPSRASAKFGFGDVRVVPFDVGDTVTDEDEEDGSGNDGDCWTRLARLWRMLSLGGCPGACLALGRREWQTACHLSPGPTGQAPIPAVSRGAVVGPARASLSV
jgi:hypothetical protein